MREVKDLKDSKTGEKIYPKCHAKATYLSNGKTVEDAEKELNDKINNINEIQFVQASDVISNIEEPLSVLEIAVAKGRELAKRDLYIAAGALYNDTDEVIERTAFWGEKVQHLPKHYYLNGLGDITEEQMAYIYDCKEAMSIILSAPSSVSRYFQDYKAPRTLFQHRDYRYTINKILSSQYVFSKGIEVVKWCKKSDWDLVHLPVISNAEWFYLCDNLYAVDAFKCSLSVNFNSSDRIKHFRVIATTAISLNVAKSSIVDKASILYFIQNMIVPSTAAASTTVRTITLHPDVYAVFSVDEDITTALSAKNEALSVKNYTLNLVSA